MFEAERLGRGGDWKLVEDDPIRGIRRFRMDIDEKHAVQRTEYYRTEQLLTHNANDRAETAGKGWGDGQLVARIPLNLAWQELAQPLIAGDEKYVNRWLNDADNRNFRIKEGKL